MFGIVNCQPLRGETVEIERAGLAARIIKCFATESVLILLASSQQICMTYTIAVCTVKNSQWRTEKLSETCRILFQK